MYNRAYSRNRWLSLILIVTFMLFATPTPSLELQSIESKNTSVSHGMDYFVQKTTISKRIPLPEATRFFTMVIVILSILLCSMMSILCRILRETHVSFKPLISRRLTHLLLSPINCTTLLP
jgi:hypothetical protein